MVLFEQQMQKKKMKRSVYLLSVLKQPQEHNYLSQDPKITKTRINLRVFLPLCIIFYGNTQMASECT